MTLPAVFLVAVALGTDAFSMAVGVGLCGITRRKIIIISALIALFHVFMPLGGLLLGNWLGKALGRLASFIGAVVLLLIGFQLLREGLSSHKQEPACDLVPMQVVYGLGGMLIMAASVSLDALTVGFGLGTLQVNLVVTVLIMGAIAGFMTLTGFFLGKRMGPWLGEKAQILGGSILMIIGGKMFF